MNTIKTYFNLLKANTHTDDDGCVSLDSQTHIGHIAIDTENADGDTFIDGDAIVNELVERKLLSAQSSYAVYFLADDPISLVVAEASDLSTPLYYIEVLY